MSSIISEICLLPRNFKLQNKSIQELLETSGFFDKPDKVFKEALVEFLKKHPDLIGEWESYSSDKRSSPSWYLQRENSGWVVGYSSTPSQEQKYNFQDPSDACAEFILRELNTFFENRKR